MKKVIPAVVAVAALATVLALAISNSDSKNKSNNSDKTSESTTTTVVDSSTEEATTENVTTDTSTNEQTTEANTDEQTTENKETESSSAVTVVTAAEGFSNRGFSHYKCEITGTYTFTVGGNESANWSVYILDNEYTEPDKYIPQDPDITKALSNDGTVDIKEGQYIYIECSLNEFTDGTPETDSNYSFCIK